METMTMISHRQRARLAGWLTLLALGLGAGAGLHLFAQNQAPPPAARSAAAPPSKPLTVAESSDFKATSTYAEVLTYVRDIQRLSPLVRVETMAVTAEGRAVPLLIIGRPAPTGPAALRNDRRVVVYVQANIHAGEVEGKEASLMLARDIVLDPKLPYLDKVVLLISPIFNADGNDKMSPDNRRGQVGPEKGSGVRTNGQNLDLNRDAMKLESPEMQGLVRNVLDRWDPLLVVDCHTTNGSYHEETVTYSWPLCPNGDPEIILYARDKMLPAIGAALEKKYGVLALPYGDPLDFRDMGKGWRTFSHQPRFMTNYIGLRNRVSILDENYNYADYKTRVLHCYALLRAILDYASARAEELARLVAEADRRTVERGLAPTETDLFGLDIEAKPLPQPVSVRGYEVEVIPREGGGFPQLKRTDVKKTYTMPYYADFQPQRTVRRPAVYLIAPPDEEVLGILHRHGLVVERLVEPVSVEVEVFRLKEVKGAERLFQGHRTNQVKGDYALEKRDFPAGTLVVRMAQPLGNLAAYLLEPESDDGLVVWNAFDRALVPQWGRGLGSCPVFKLFGAGGLVTDTAPGR